MPYISPAKNRRVELDPCRAEVALNEGELNFQISMLMNQYLTENGLNYGNLGDCTAACENAAAELRRRLMAPYEDEKIRENGDVYESTLALLPQPPF